MNENDNENKLNFLKEEFNQAWAHYRHVENGRDAYLRFGLTLMLGTVGYLGAIARVFDPSTDSYWWIVAGIFVFTTIVAVILMSWLVAVVDSGLIMKHYKNVWKWVRSEIYLAQSEEITKRIDIYRNEEVMGRPRFFDHQNIW